MNRFEKAVLLFAVMLVAVGLISQSVNSGFNFPDNGPCVPLPKSAGICNDSGVFATYDHDGVLTHLPTPGPHGDAATVAIGQVATGTPGSAASVNNSGTSAEAVFDISIPAGLPGKDAVFPQKIRLTCAPGVGSVPKGFSLDCTQVPQ